MWHYFKQMIEVKKESPSEHSVLSDVRDLLLEQQVTKEM